MYSLTRCTLIITIINISWQGCLVLANYSPSISSLNDDLQSDSFTLDAINGTHDFRLNFFKDQFRRPWRTGGHREPDTTQCVRPAKCEKLQNATCFGIKIPYRSTSSLLTESEQIRIFEALRNIPKCWAVVQPFLCAVFMPKCEKIKDRDMVFLPSYDMCRVTMEPCRILYNTTFFPSYLKCTDSNFPCRNCANDVREMKFNATGQCMPPLVQTDSSLNHYKDIEGCGIQCKDPLYTDDEHEAVHSLIFWGTLLCIICNLFVIATFLIHDWKHSKHPAWNLFYISICLLFNWIGWFIQFWPGHRENIICRSDGTLRHSEPSAGENLACIFPFTLIYYFLIAANIWFAIFTYAWYLQTTDRGGLRDRINKGIFYFHFIAWALPLVLFIMIMVLSEVEGNSIIGICFVGYTNRSIRIGLVLFPVAILSFGFSLFFTFLGTLNLNRIKKSTNSGKEMRRINSHILAMGIRTMLILFFIFAFFVFENYEIQHAEVWSKSLNELIVCKIQSSYSPQPSICKLKNRPSVAMLQLRLLCLFCVNLVISSWCLTWSAFKSWSRFIKRKTGWELDEDERITKPKHRIIADAYAKRMDDVISVSVQNSHTDPAGINFDVKNLDPLESNSIGGSLLNYLSTMMTRRNAVTSMDFNQPNVTCAYNGSSCDSEINVSVRHYNLSVESRRSSVDSQVSVKMSGTETEIKAKVSGQKHKSLNMKAKKRQRNFYAKRTNRRASSSSVESQRITNQMQNMRFKGPNTRIQLSALQRQSERRNACTTRDIRDITKLLNHDRIPPISFTTSDEEQSNNESQRQHFNSTKMIMPADYRSDDSVSLDMQDEIDLKALAPVLQHVLRNSNGNDLQTFIKSLEIDGFGKENRIDEPNENQQLLPMTKRTPSIIARKDPASMSESERKEVFRKLLLPSKN